MHPRFGGYGGKHGHGALGGIIYVCAPYRCGADSTTTLASEMHAGSPATSCVPWPNVW